MQGQSTMQFNSATRLTLNPGTSQALTGGTRLSTYSVVYIRAGETVVFTCWASDVGNGTSPGYTYEPCPDVDSNGICDEYDAAARAFGDFDSSGSVNGADLAALLAAWGSSGSACDINRDGYVDGTDLTFLLSRWGQGAP